MEPQPNLQRTQLILTAAFVSACLIYLLVGVFLLKSDWRPAAVPETTLRMLLIALFAIAFLISAFALNYNRLPGGADPGTRAVLSRTITSQALAEVPAILGLIYFLLSGELLYLALLCAISIATLLLLKKQL